jgi:hypothetical protein
MLASAERDILFCMSSDVITSVLNQLFVCSAV